MTQIPGNRTRLFFPALLLTLLLPSLSQDASAGLKKRLGLFRERQAPAATSAELRTRLFALGENRDPGACVAVSERQYGGVTRICINPRGAKQLKAVEALLNKDCNVLEICHLGYDQFDQGNGSRGSTNHTFGIFNRTAPHVNAYNGWTDWKINDTGRGSLRESTRRTFSALIQLTPSEAKRFQDTISLGHALQAADANGYLVVSPDRLDKVKKKRPELFQDPLVLENIAPGGRLRNWNCVAFFSEMKLGDQGEPLWKLLGLNGSHSGNPRGLQQALETQANDRVAGLCVYNGPLPKGGHNNAVFYWEPGSLE